MSKRAPWAVILEILARFPQGASLEEILVGLPPEVARRSLQRWLSQSEGRIRLSGTKRGRRYHLAAAEKPCMALSAEAEALWKEIRQPLSLRPPASFHREFLDSYKPNHSFYLSQELRLKLHNIGKSATPYLGQTFNQQIVHRLLVDLAWNSSRLEGNTYSLLETEQLLFEGQPAVGKTARETQMIINHKAAIEFLLSEGIVLNKYTIINLHALLSDNLLPNPASCGRLRTIAVGISSSTYLPPSIPQLIAEAFEHLIQIASTIQDPFEQAFFLLVHLPYLQPFDDVNKRTARLAANIPLLKAGLCPLSFIDVPEQTYIDGLLAIYEQNRVELLRDLFLWAYERSALAYTLSRQQIGEPDPFILHYRDALKKAVALVVQSLLDKSQAIAAIRHEAEALPTADRARFIELAERELQSLHSGNIARYKLALTTFTDWQKKWL